MPRLEGICEQDVPVQATVPGAGVAGTQVRYGGAGHPGRPRPRAIGERRLALRPETMERQGFDRWVVSARGTMLATLGAGMQLERVAHVRDFVVALSALGDEGVDRVAWAGMYGAFGVVGFESGRHATPGSHLGSPDPVPELEATLPSAVYRSSPALSMSARGIPEDLEELRGMVFGMPGGPPGAHVVLSASAAATVATPFTGAMPLRAYAADRVVRAAPARGGGVWAAVVARAGRRPALAVASWTGRLSGSTVEWEAGAPATPLVVKTVAGPADTYFALVSWDLDSTAPPDVTAGEIADGGHSGAPGTDGGQMEIGSADGGLPDGGRPLRQGGDLYGSLTVAQVAPKQNGPNWPGKIEDNHGSADVAGRRFVDADGLYDSASGQLHLFAVDGETAALHHYVASDGNASLAPKLVRSTPTAGIGWRVSAEAASSAEAVAGYVVVADREGVFHRHALPRGAGASLVEVESARPWLGARGVAPRSRSSCEDAPVAVAASLADSLVVAPAQASEQPAFLPSVSTPVSVDVAGIDRPGLTSLVWYLSAGAAGTAIVETPAQRRDAGHRAEGAVLDFASLSVLALPVAQDRSFVVAGGRRGLAVFELTPSFEPPARWGGGYAMVNPSRTWSECPGAAQLARLGTRALVLSHSDGLSRLCVLDPQDGSVRRGPELSGWDVRAIAAASVANRSAPGERIWLGWVAGRLAAEPHDLVVATTDADAAGRAVPVRIPLAGAVAARLPTPDTPVVAMGASPDGRRLLVGFGGDHPGVIALDPVLLATEKDEQVRAESVTTLSLPARPVGFSFTSDGARATAVLDDDIIVTIE